MRKPAHMRSRDASGRCSELWCTDIENMFEIGAWCGPAEANVWIEKNGYGWLVLGPQRDYYQHHDGFGK